MRRVRQEGQLPSSVEIVRETFERLDYVSESLEPAQVIARFNEMLWNLWKETRGGKDFELQIEGLLDLAGLPYHRQETENRTDLILPDLQTHRANRNISAVVSIKRTLRERWAEVAEELFNLRSPNVFLFTADDSVSQNHVNRICDQYNIHLVVWDHVKRSKHPERPLVLGYSDWATDRLPVIMQYWRNP